MEKKLTYRDYARFARLTPDELYEQCEVDVFRATGPGGQGVNTTDSAVRMRHAPTGIVVTSREQRSQLRNRQPCRNELDRHRRHLRYQVCGSGMVRRMVCRGCPSSG